MNHQGVSNLAGLRRCHRVRVWKRSGMADVSRFQVTADDLRHYDWQAVLRGARTKECHEYYTGFLRALEERQKAGDDLGVRVYRLLAVVASFHPNYDAAGNP